MDVKAKVSVLSGIHPDQVNALLDSEVLDLEGTLYVREDFNEKRVRKLFKDKSIMDTAAQVVDQTVRFKKFIWMAYGLGISLGIDILVKILT